VSAEFFAKEPKIERDTIFDTFAGIIASLLNIRNINAFIPYGTSLTKSTYILGSSCDFHTHRDGMMARGSIDAEIFLSVLNVGQGTTFSFSLEGHR